MKNSSRLQTLPTFNLSRPMMSAAIIQKFISIWLLFMTCNCWHLMSSPIANDPAAPPLQSQWHQYQPQMVESITNTLDDHSNEKDGGNVLPTKLNVTPKAKPQSAVDINAVPQASSKFTATKEEGPEEIQKAVCTVSAGEVRASAEAVTTKTLKGVCSSAEMNSALQRLELKILNELHEMKAILKQIATLSGLPVQQTELHEVTTATPVTSTANIITPANITKSKPATSSISKGVGKKIKFHSISLNPMNSNSSRDTEKLTPLKLKNSDTSTQSILSSKRREQEVSKFNNTMLGDNDFRIFTYYWRLENITAYIETDESRVLFSPVFSIKGKALQIKACFQHLHRDFLYLHLAYASSLASSSKQNNIILDMGGSKTESPTVFKEITTKVNVLFKYKICILDQNNQRSKDLASQEFNNLDTGFLIPNSAILGSPFIKNDTFLIQIFLYL